MLQELKSGSGGALFLAFLFFLSSFPVFLFAYLTET